jgi:hypothetical protein
MTNQNTHVQNTSCKLKSIFFNKFWNIKKIPHSHINKKLVWNQSSTKPMSKNSKLGRKTTNYLLTSNYSCFNKMIQAYTWTIPFGGGLNWYSPLYLLMHHFSKFWCRWGGKHPLADLAKFGYYINMKVKLLKHSYTFWLITWNMHTNLVIFLDFLN